MTGIVERLRRIVRRLQPFSVRMWSAPWLIQPAHHVTERCAPIKELYCFIAKFDDGHEGIVWINSDPDGQPIGFATKCEPLERKAGIVQREFAKWDNPPVSIRLAKFIAEDQSRSREVSE